MRYLIIIMISITLVSCQKKQKDISTQQLNRFVETFKTYLLIATADTAKFENRSIYLDSALARNKYTRQEFDSVLKYLGENPNEMEKFANAFSDSLKILSKKQNPKDIK